MKTFEQLEKGDPVFILSRDGATISQHNVERVNHVNDHGQRFVDLWFDNYNSVTVKAKATRGYCVNFMITTNGDDLARELSNINPKPTAIC